MNLKLTLGYDGTEYNGWQVQKGQAGSRTVQCSLEQAISTLTGEVTKVQAAGRTDAGVHARRQVVSFHTAGTIPLKSWPAAVNSLLPRDIRVYHAERCTDEFHARYHAKKKTYIYRIDNNPVPDIFWLRFAVHIPYTLDLTSMKKAAKFFEGSHNFQGFCAGGSSVKNFNRTIYNCRLQEQSKIMQLEITADGFLYNMVRIIAGTLLEVGAGRVAAGEISGIIGCGKRQAAGPTAPAKGLCLENVAYD